MYSVIITSGGVTFESVRFDRDELGERSEKPYLYTLK